MVTFADEWKEFSDRCFHGADAETQKRLRAVFYTGAVTIMALMERVANDAENKYEIHAAFDALGSELLEFVEEIVAEEGNEK